MKKNTTAGTQPSITFLSKMFIAFFALILPTHSCMSSWRCAAGNLNPRSHAAVRCDFAPLQSPLASETPELSSTTRTKHSRQECLQVVPMLGAVWQLAARRRQTQARSRPAWPRQYPAELFHMKRSRRAYPQPGNIATKLNLLDATLCISTSQN
jgi:hypothetical protein